MQGLGRGRGFWVTERYSALDDEELVDRIVFRLHLLLDLTEVHEEEGRETKIEELKAEVDRLQTMVNEFEGELAEDED